MVLPAGLFTTVQLNVSASPSGSDDVLPCNSTVCPRSTPAGTLVITALGGRLAISAVTTTVSKSTAMLSVMRKRTMYSPSTSGITLACIESLSSIEAVLPAGILTKDQMYSSRSSFSSDDTLPLRCALEDTLTNVSLPALATGG